MYNESLSRRKYETDRFKVVNDTVAQVLGITIQVGTSCLSAFLVLNGQITVGMLAAVIQLCRYDQIIYMKNGRIAEKGSFQELINMKGDFYRFFHSS